MNELLERILDLPPRQRILLLMGSVAALFFLYAYLVYWPRSTAIAEKEQQREQLIQERDRKAGRGLAV